MASIVQMKSGDQGIFLGELKNVSEYRVSKNIDVAHIIIVGAYFSFPCLQLS